jgi:hypothetical protein
MDLNRMDGVRQHAVDTWRKVREQFTRLPATARVVSGLFLLAAFLMALHTAFSGSDASLRLKVQHSVRSGQLSVWVDGNLAYSATLAGSTKRKFGLIPEVQGSLSENLPVASGTHRIKVQIVSDGGQVENTISGDFSRNQQQTLSVNASRADLSLHWQSAQALGVEPLPSNQGWLSRYAGTLMMTIAGSIVSALTGFALKELPKHVASRQQAPKT